MTRTTGSLATAPLLRTRRIGTIEVRESTGATRGIGAASGLIKLGESLFVAPDDSKHVAVLPADGSGPGRLMRALPGRLPKDADALKNAKPDLEALAALPPSEQYPHGALLAVASGSGHLRQTSVVWALGPNGLPQGKPTSIDMEPLVKALAAHFDDLNLEGAAVVNDSLRLYQRGNQTTGKNGIVDLNLKKTAAALAAGRPLDESLIESVRPIDLGTLNGCNLTLSDASPLGDGRVVFTASAENTPNSYEDGALVGAGVGVMAADGTVEQFVRVSKRKLEGVHAEKRGDFIHLLMVEDADDPSAVSPLLRATLRDR